MAMHLLRKASASNSNTFGRYKISKLRSIFLVVILVEQAEASNITHVSQGLQTVSVLYLADQAHGHHPTYGNSILHIAV